MLVASSRRALSLTDLSPTQIASRRPKNLKTVHYLESERKCPFPTELLQKFLLYFSCAEGGSSYGVHLHRVLKHKEIV